MASGFVSTLTAWFSIPLVWRKDLFWFDTAKLLTVVNLVDGQVFRKILMALVWTKQRIRLYLTWQIQNTMQTQLLAKCTTSLSEIGKKIQGFEVSLSCIWNTKKSINHPGSVLGVWIVQWGLNWSGSKFSLHSGFLVIGRLMSRLSFCPRVARCQAV